MIDDGRESLERLLQTFTYKPDWAFTIIEEGLLIRLIAVDTDNHRNRIPITFSIGIPSFVRPDFPWDRWLLDQIMEVEKHEAREFFKVNGVKVFDPHA